jgi:tetratricopeptide (TPR) repeat protein
MGVKPILYGRDPYVGFVSQIPLFVAGTDAAGRPVMVTAPNKHRLFNPQQFAQPKAPGTYRIFTVGGSTTYGRPYDDSTSFTGWVREFLEAGVPGRRWEVINAGGISYASYRVALLMEELVQYEPDLFVVYSGHNEFLERRTYRQVREMPAWVRQLGLLAGKTRTGALVQKAADRLRRKRASANESLVRLESEVVTLLDNTVGPEAFERDDELRDQILRHYRFNLARICDIARSAGAEVILVTPACNLRAATPFKSEHRSDLGPTDLARWQGAYNDGLRAFTNGLPDQALEAFDTAASIDDRHAHLHLLRGHSLFNLERFAEAKSAYQQACDEDVCPLRALTSMPGLVREVAEEQAVPVIDFVALQERLSEHGIPGAQVFLDHVHPTVESHRLLALEILKVLTDQGVLEALPTSAVVEQVTQRVLAEIDPERNAVALVNLSKVLGWAGRIEDAYRLAVRASRTAPDLAAVQFQAGVCAQLLGKPQEAIQFYRRTIEIDPTAALAHGNLGVALEDVGQLHEALTHFERALQYGNPSDVERDQRNLDRVQRRLAEATQSGP